MRDREKGGKPLRNIIKYIVSYEYGGVVPLSSLGSYLLFNCGNNNDKIIISLCCLRIILLPLSFGFL